VAQVVRCNTYVLREPPWLFPLSSASFTPRTPPGLSFQTNRELALLLALGLCEGLDAANGGFEVG
jgi:hypothetical protein